MIESQFYRYFLDFLRDCRWKVVPFVDVVFFIVFFVKKRENHRAIQNDLLANFGTLNKPKKKDFEV